MVAFNGILIYSSYVFTLLFLFHLFMVIKGTMEVKVDGCDFVAIKI